MNTNLEDLFNSGSSPRAMPCEQKKQEACEPQPESLVLARPPCRVYSFRSGAYGHGWF